MTASEHERSILSSRVDAAAGAARVARYGAAWNDAHERWCEGDVHSADADLGHDEYCTRAVMAVADEERAADRAEIERLRRCGAEHPTNHSVVSCTLDRDDHADGLHWSSTGCAGSATSWPTAEARLDALVADLRGLADDFDTAVGFRGAATSVRAVLDKHAGEQAQGGEGS
jgi:hypothetical protein